MFSIPIIETLVAIVLAVMAWGGLVGLFLLMTVESFGIPPLPSEVILPFAGYLIYSGTFAAGPAIAVALAGGLTGSLIAYAVGRWGRGVLTAGPGPLRLTPAHLAAMDNWFRRHGESAVIFSRLVPVIRGYVSYPAGAAEMAPGRFSLYSLAGATPFTLALLYVGYQLGANWTEVLPIFHLLDYAAVAAMAVAVLYVALRWRGRLSAGWPPRLTRSSGSPPPAGGAPPSGTGPRSPPG